MAITAAWRPDSYDLRYSNYGKTGQRVNIGGPTLGVDAGAIGGNSLDCTSTTAHRALEWSGKNFANGRLFSALVRVKPNYTGSPAGNRGIWGADTGNGNTSGQSINLIHTSAGNFIVFARSETATIVNSVTAAAWSPTSGTWYDVGVAWDGTTTANSLKVYIDGALLGSGITPTGAWSSSTTRDYWKVISMGSVTGATVCAMTIGEMITWDEIIDFTSNVTLTSGSGLLNGASRTAFVDVASFDGLTSTGGGSTHSSSYNWSN